MTERCTANVEIRAAESGPTLHAVILTEGRAASGGRAEVFAPGAVQWPAEGIELRVGHDGASEGRAVPVRADAGEIRISAPATPKLFAAVHGGKKFASVEFHALQERRTAGGVREVLSALVVGAALTDRPEFDTTRAEIRTRQERRVWL